MTLQHRRNEKAQEVADIGGDKQGQSALRGGSGGQLRDPGACAGANDDRKRQGKKRRHPKEASEDQASKRGNGRKSPDQGVVPSFLPETQTRVPSAEKSRDFPRCEDSPVHRGSGRRAISDMW